MTVNHGCNVYVSASGFENGENSKRVPGDVAYPVYRVKKKESKGEKSLALLIVE